MGASNEAFLLHEMILYSPPYYYPRKGNTITTHNNNNLPLVAMKPLQTSSVPLELPRLKVYNSDILHDPLQTRHKLQMRRVLLKVVFPVFFGLEFAYEAMTETALYKPRSRENVINICAFPVFERDRGKRETNLEPLGTIIPPASVRLDVGFLRCGVEAVVFQGEHALADILHLGRSDCWVELEEDDVDDWHYE